MHAYLLRGEGACKPAGAEGQRVARPPPQVLVVLPVTRLQGVPHGPLVQRGERGGAAGAVLAHPGDAEVREHDREHRVPRVLLRRPARSGPLTVTPGARRTPPQPTGRSAGKGHAHAQAGLSPHAYGDEAEGPQGYAGPPGTETRHV